MLEKLQNYLAFICSKIDIKIFLFIMIFIGTVFYVPRWVLPDFIPVFYDYLFYLKYIFMFIVIVFTVPVFFKRKFCISINKYVIIMSLYVLVCLLSIFFNQGKYVGEGLTEFRYLFYSFFMFLVIVYNLRGDEHKILLYAMTGLILYNSVFSYISIIFGFGKEFGLFENRVPFGCLMVVVSTYMTILFFNEKSAVKKKLFLLVSIFLFVNITLLLQRSVYLAYFFSIIVIILATKNKKIITYGILLCVIIGLFLGLMTLHRMKKESMNIVNYSDIGRLSSLYAGFDMWKTHPVFGVGHGTGSYRAGEHAAFTHKIVDKSNAFPIHNILIQQLAETGLVGFFLFNAFNLMLLTALYRKFKDKKNIVKEAPYEIYYFIAISVYIINGMLHPMNFREGYYWYLCAGAIILLNTAKTKYADCSCQIVYSDTEEKEFYENSSHKFIR